MLGYSLQSPTNAPVLVVLPEATFTQLAPDLRCSSIGLDLLGGSEPVNVTGSPAMPADTEDFNVPAVAA